MRKVWYVARFEFIRFATRRGFLFIVVGLPLLLSAIIAVTYLIISGQANDPVGVVDNAGITRNTNSANVTRDVPIRAFPTESAALSALESDELQAYFVIEPDYLATGNIRLVHAGDTFEGIYDSINDYLRAALLADAGLTLETAQLIADGELNFAYVALSGGSSGNEFTDFIFPFIIGFLLVMAIFTTASYMLQAVVDEKENRTMELLVTSLSPERLMTGKMLGLVSVGMLQILTWATFVAVAFVLLRTRVAFLGLLAPPFELIAVAFVWFLPFYVTFAAIMSAIGITVTEVSEGQQASSILTLLVALPFYFMFALISAPDSPVSVALSLFPLTAPLSILIRWPLTTIPAWQLITSWCLLALSAVLALVLVSRLLRLGMLRYGQRMSLRQIGAAFARPAGRRGGRGRVDSS